MKKTIKVVFYFLFLLLLSASAGTAYYYFKAYTQVFDLVQQEKIKNRNHTIEEERIKDMIKTLTKTYNLSRFEARYYAVILNDFSQYYRIPWEVYAAVIRIESNFNGTVCSPKGAKGIMQLLEPTGRGVANELGINYTESQSLWNELINITLGCSYLSKAIKSKGLEGGICVYLGGPDYLKSIQNNKDADKYLSQYKSTVWKEFVLLSYIFRGIVNEQSEFSYEEVHGVVIPDITDRYSVKDSEIALFRDTVIKDTFYEIPDNVVDKNKKKSNGNNHKAQIRALKDSTEVKLDSAVK